MAGLATRQNTDRSLDLQRAIAVTHKRAQWVHTTALTVSLLVAALGLLARLEPKAIPAVSLVGALWTAIYAIALAPWAARYQRTSATLQEMLDTSLFGQPWNRVLVGPPVPEELVSDLSSRYRDREEWVRDYYIVAVVPAPYDVLFCLEQNLAWGSRVRQRYGQLLASVAGIWVLAGLVIGFATGVRVPALISAWLVPSLGLLLLCLDTYRTQLANTRERTRVRELVIGLTADQHGPRLTPGPEWVALARQIQDVLFILRRQQSRTPAWFFRRYHDRDKRAFEYRKRVLEERLGPP